MLWSGGGFGSGFLAVTLVKAIDASCGIDQLLFTREEGVASRTDFDVQVALLGGASLECLAARAGDGNFNVFGMNSWFHFLSLSIGGPRPHFQTRHDRGRGARSSSNGRLLSASLRPSAYLGGPCVYTAFNTEITEIRRGPQKKSLPHIS
jgi:hypothetical protein